MLRKVADMPGIIKGGYILQPRIFDTSESSKMPPVTRELWFYLLRNVNFSDNGKIKRGQGFFRFEDIQNALSWYVGYRKMMYSKPQLTKSLRRLCESNMVETAKETRGIMITICNFNHFQDPKNYEGNGEGIAKELRRVKGDNTILEEEVQEVKEDKKENITKDIKRFMSPSLQEVKEYCLERENGIDAERFINFYESKGWMIGKNKMKCWKSAVRTWEKNNHTKQNQPRPMTVSESLIVQREKIAEALYNDPDDPFNSPARRAQIRANQLSGNKDDGKPVENAGGGLVRGPEK